MPSPAQPQPTPEGSADQGFLFGTEVVRSGVTDPALDETDVHIVEGVGYPEPPQEIAVPDVPDDATMASVKEAAKTKRRHDGQLGKHSVLEREGRYADLETGETLIKAGDFLKGFGQVTYSNLALAREYAENMERQRQQRHR
ncbi:MAG TPA: hypothetical protein VLF87_03905 [Patescibacteria group bacterium]|nr:hypothetical protein [Patescibacteria group bacterium]